MASCGKHFSYENSCKPCRMVDEYTEKQKREEEEFHSLLRQAERAAEKGESIDSYVEQLHSWKVVDCPNHSFFDRECGGCYQAELSRKHRDETERRVRELERTAERAREKKVDLGGLGSLGAAAGIHTGAEHIRKSAASKGDDSGFDKTAALGIAVILLGLGALWVAWKVISFVAPVLVPALVVGGVLWYLHKSGKLPWPKK